MEIRIEDILHRHDQNEIRRLNLEANMRYDNDSDILNSRIYTPDGRSIICEPMGFNKK